MDHSPNQSIQSIENSDKVIGGGVSLLSSQPISSDKSRQNIHPLQTGSRLSQQLNSTTKSFKEQKKKENKIDKIQVVKKPAIDDYIWQYQIGRGSYGEVILGKQKSNDKEYAIKVVDKQFMAKQKKQYQVFIEKEMLFNLKHPGIVNLFSTFSTPEKLYFVMEHLEGGDFAQFIRLNQIHFTYETIKFYLAEMVSVLEFMHSKGVAHRDLKPENILLTKERHIKLIDFGTASIYNYDLAPKDFGKSVQEIKGKFRNIDNKPIFEREESKHRATFVGTAEYVSPELLEDDICQNQADIWALGCILYKMFTGTTPFYENSEYIIFQKIKNGNFTIPESVPDEAQDLLRRLIVRDPFSRLGAGPKGSDNDYDALKNHPFFKGIFFDQIWEAEAPKYQSFKVTRDTIDPDLQVASQNVPKVQKKSSIIFNGLVLLKTFLFMYKPVEMVLQNSKTCMVLVFYDPECHGIIQMIPITENVHLWEDDRYMYIVQENRKKHVIKEVQHPITKWIEFIERSRQNKKQQAKGIY